MAGKRHGAGHNPVRPAGGVPWNEFEREGGELDGLDMGGRL